MRAFHVNRTTDHSGVSGTGLVAKGIEFGDGLALLRWSGTRYRSVAIYPDFETLKSVHEHSGSTTFDWQPPFPIGPMTEPYPIDQDYVLLIAVHTSLVWSIPEWLKRL